MKQTDRNRSVNGEAAPSRVVSFPCYYREKAKENELSEKQIVYKPVMKTYRITLKRTGKIEFSYILLISFEIVFVYC